MSRISRTDFLRGDFSGRRVPVRPPWAHEESLFVEKCTRCQQCIDTCPERIINKGRGGYPAVDFKLGECTFCGDCVRACKDGALHCPDEQFDAAKAWKIKATIQPDCLAHNGVECRVCGEHCESAAIRFQLIAGMAAIPRVNNELCNGCGACLAACPVVAVRIGAPASPARTMNNDLATAS